jgi:hypothetical protein
MRNEPGPTATAQRRGAEDAEDAEDGTPEGLVALRAGIELLNAEAQRRRAAEGLRLAVQPRFERARTTFSLTLPLGMLLVASRAAVQSKHPGSWRFESSSTVAVLCASASLRLCVE